MRRLILTAVALVAFVLVLSGQFSVSARGPDLSRAIAALEAHNPQLLNIAGVAGTGVGVDASGEGVIRIFLERPGVPGIPARLNGVATETVVTGMFVAQCTRTSHCDSPVPIGVSTGHTSITAGTYGARVKDGSGNFFALSNNHVFANSNNASIGDNILQPGPYDGGTVSNDLFGTLYDFEPIKFDGSNNIMDAAIMQPTSRTLSGATLPEGYGSPTSNVTAATVGLAVKKYGRTTGLTNGSVAEVNVTVNVCYAVRGIFCTQSARFVNQFTVSPGSFSAGGDSGSLIVTATGNNPVGLLFAGSSSRTIASPIGPVLTRFGVTIDGGGGGGGSTPVPTNTPVPATATPVPPTATPTSAPVGGTVSVSSISYSTSGGPNRDRHLTVTVSVVDGNGLPVNGAAVSLVLNNTTTGGSWSASGTTGTNGIVSFTLNNFPAGCYTSSVQSVSANGLTWDGNTPTNGHCK